MDIRLSGCIDSIQRLLTYAQATGLRVEVRVYAPEKSAAYDNDHADEVYRDPFLDVNFTAASVRVRGERVYPTRTELKVLRELVLNRHRTVTPYEISKVLWGPSDPTEGGSIKTYIHRLRTKLGDRPPERIVSVRDFGYQYVPPEE